MNKMQNMGTYLPLQEHNGAQRNKYIRYSRRCTTYPGMIACVIQDSPDRMLTFSQLMDKLRAFVVGDRKGLENNIRVCLSTNGCFVKVPVSPYMPNSKKNFWRIDESRITAKMVRRHFKGILDKFPELSSKVGMDADKPSERCVTISPTPASTTAYSPTLAFTTRPKRCEVKFTSPFSIESLLKRDSPSQLCPKVAPFSVLYTSAPVSVEQQAWREKRDVGAERKLRWASSSPDPHPRAGDSYAIYTTGDDTAHGLISGVSAKPSKKMRVCADLSMGVAPHFTNPCVVKHHVPTYAYDSQHFRL